MNHDGRKKDFVLQIYFNKILGSSYKTKLSNNDIILHGTFLFFVLYFSFQESNVSLFFAKNKSSLRLGSKKKKKNRRKLKSTLTFLLRYLIARLRTCNLCSFCLNWTFLFNVSASGTSITAATSLMIHSFVIIRYFSLVPVSLLTRNVIAYKT